MIKGRFVSDIREIRRRARQLEEILSTEEQHADDLARLLTWLRPEKNGEPQPSPEQEEP